MSYSYPIYCKVKRKDTVGFARALNFGARDSFNQSILVGTRATNSPELATVSVERRALPDGIVEFSLYLDDVLIRRGILDGKEFTREDTAGVDDDGDATFANLGYRKDDNAEA